MAFAQPVPPPAAKPVPAAAVGSLTYQVLERALRPGEVSLDDLEKAFRETAVAPPPKPAPAPEAKPQPAAAARSDAAEAAKAAREKDDELKPDSKVANQSIR